MYWLKITSKFSFFFFLQCSQKKKKKIHLNDHQVIIYKYIFAFIAH